MTFQTPAIVFAANANAEGSATLCLITPRTYFALAIRERHSYSTARAHCPLARLLVDVCSFLSHIAVWFNCTVLMLKLCRGLTHQRKSVRHVHPPGWVDKIGDRDPSCSDSTVFSPSSIVICLRHQPVPRIPILQAKKLKTLNTVQLPSLFVRSVKSRRHLQGQQHMWL